MKQSIEAPQMSWPSFVRFALVGGFCFLSGLAGVYLLTDGLGWHYLLSTAVSVIGANVLGWLLNRSWTFELRTRRSPREFLRYALVNACGMGVSLAMLRCRHRGRGKRH